MTWKVNRQTYTILFHPFHVSLVSNSLIHFFLFFLSWLFSLHCTISSLLSLYLLYTPFIIINRHLSSYSLHQTLLSNSTELESRTFHFSPPALSFPLSQVTYKPTRLPPITYKLTIVPESGNGSPVHLAITGTPPHHGTCAALPNTAPPSILPVIKPACLRTRTGLR